MVERKKGWNDGTMESRKERRKKGVKRGMKERWRVGRKGRRNEERME